MRIGKSQQLQREVRTPVDMLKIHVYIDCQKSVYDLFDKTASDTEQSALRDFILVKLVSFASEVME